MMDGVQLAGYVIKSAYKKHITRILSTVNGISLYYGDSPVKFGGRPFYRTKSIRFLSKYLVQKIKSKELNYVFQKFREHRG